MKKFPLQDGKNATHTKIKVNEALHEYYDRENLNIIGGFQDGNELKFLMYKEDVKQLEKIEMIIEMFDQEREQGA